MRWTYKIHISGHLSTAHTLHLYLPQLQNQSSSPTGGSLKGQQDCDDPGLNIEKEQQCNLGVHSFSYSPPATAPAVTKSGKLVKHKMIPKSHPLYPV